MAKSIKSVYLDNEIVLELQRKSQGTFKLSNLINKLLQQYNEYTDETTDKKILSMKINKLSNLIESKRTELNKFTVEHTALVEKLQNILGEEESVRIKTEEQKKVALEIANTCIICNMLFNEKDNKTVVKDGRFAHNLCYLSASKEKRASIELGGDSL